MGVAMRFIVLLLLLSLAPWQLAMAAEPAPAAAALDPENTLYLDLNTGRVVIRMRPDLAPKTVERIKHLVRGGFYDGMAFHRVIDGFMAQTGDPKGDGSGGTGRPLSSEFTSTPQVRGAVSMGLKPGKRNSADSQWFIVLSDNNQSSLNRKYTMWAEVVSGMEFVDMIKKGDMRRDGAVAEPDTIVRLQVAADADAPASGNGLARADAAATARNFSAGEFRCSAFARSSGGAQPTLARLWTHGYLAGYAKAKGALTFAGTPDDVRMNQGLDAACQQHPHALLLAVASQELSKTAVELPPSTPAFNPTSTTCADFTAARKGGSTAQADFIELWTFAFLQGYKNVGQPDLEIPYDARARILAAFTNACVKNAAMPYIELVTLGATRVKLQK